MHTPLRDNLFRGGFKIDPKYVSQGLYIGCYHSHPFTSARLTGLDKQNIGKLGLKLWMIYSLAQRNYRFFFGNHKDSKMLITLKRQNGVKILL